MLHELLIFIKHVIFKNLDHVQYFIKKNVFSLFMTAQWPLYSSRNKNSYSSIFREGSGYKIKNYKIKILYSNRGKS